jgi:flagellar biosynthesis/type III secretory pathway chaperone
MTAADRLAALENLDAATLCAKAETALSALVNVMNRETTLLRAGHMRQAGELTGEKTQLAQDYVTLARTVQRVAPRLKAEAPERLDTLRRGHEALATQMAENLRVLATARSVTETILSDVARQVAKADKPKTYGSSGQAPAATGQSFKGLSVNKAL